MTKESEKTMTPTPEPTPAPKRTRKPTDPAIAAIKNAAKEQIAKLRQYRADGSKAKRCKKTIESIGDRNLAELTEFAVCQLLKRCPEMVLTSGKTAAETYKLC